MLLYHQIFWQSYLILSYLASKTYINKIDTSIHASIKSICLSMDGYFACQPALLVMRIDKSCHLSSQLSFHSSILIQLILYTGSSKNIELLNIQLPPLVFACQIMTTKKIN